MLDIVKESLLIPAQETYADSELNMHIDACKQLLVSSGVNKEVVDNESNKMVEALILIYCKTFFGFKNDGSVKELPKSFDMLLKQLVFSAGGNS